MTKLAIGLAATVLMPVIWGDGIHDDTVGFEALVCGEVFAFPNRNVIITYGTDGRQSISFDAEAIFVLPDGIPTPTNSTRTIRIDPGKPTYPIDCAARKVS